MRAAPLLAALALLAGCADATEPAAEDAPAEPEVVASEVLGVSDGYVRSAPAGGVSAVFFEVANGTATADTLVAARTDAAGRVEIHRTGEVGGGLSGMTPVEVGVAVGPGETVTLEPGGLHVMLLDLQRDLAEGETLDVDLDFASGQTLTVSAPVRGIE